jgi:hypothetical protein
MSGTESNTRVYDIACNITKSSDCGLIFAVVLADNSGRLLWRGIIDSETKYLTTTFRGTAEINGVGLDDVGIELVLADQLAQAVGSNPDGGCGGG